MNIKVFKIVDVFFFLFFYPFLFFVRWFAGAEAIKSFEKQ